MWCCLLNSKSDTEIDLAVRLFGHITTCVCLGDDIKPKLGNNAGNSAAGLIEKAALGGMGN